jgi:hypothetical protein
VRRRNEHKRTAVKKRTPVANSLITGTSANPAPAPEQPTAQDIFTAYESHFLSLTAKSDKKLHSSGNKQRCCHQRKQCLSFNTVFQRTLAFRPASRRDGCFLGPVGPSLNHRRRSYNPGAKPAASNVTTDRIRHINLLRKAMREGEAPCIQKQRVKTT